MRRPHPPGAVLCHIWANWSIKWADDRRFGPNVKHESVNLLPQTFFFTESTSIKDVITDGLEFTEKLEHYLFHFIDLAIL